MYLTGCPAHGQQPSHLLCIGLLWFLNSSQYHMKNLLSNLCLPGNQEEKKLLSPRLAGYQLFPSLWGNMFHSKKQSLQGGKKKITNKFIVLFYLIWIFNFSNRLTDEIRRRFKRTWRTQPPTNQEYFLLTKKHIACEIRSTKGISSRKLSDLTSILLFSYCLLLSVWRLYRQKSRKLQKSFVFAILKHGILGKPRRIYLRSSFCSGWDQSLGAGAMN